MRIGVDKCDNCGREVKDRWTERSWIRFYRHGGRFKLNVLDLEDVEVFDFCSLRCLIEKINAWLGDSQDDQRPA